MRGNRSGESQALAYLAERLERQGDDAGALEMTLESATISREIGWTWFEAGQLSGAATLERERGNLDAAERHARRALELYLGLGDLQGIVFNAAELAIIASEEADPARAGLLWGAVETQVRAGRVGRWERRKEELEALVLRADGPAFQQARAEGHLLSIPQAAGLEPS